MQRVQIQVPLVQVTVACVNRYKYTLCKVFFGSMIEKFSRLYNEVVDAGRKSQTKKG